MFSQPFSLGDTLTLSCSVCVPAHSLPPRRRGPGPSYFPVDPSTWNSTWDKQVLNDGALSDWVNGPPLLQPLGDSPCRLRVPVGLRKGPERLPLMAISWPSHSTMWCRTRVPRARSYEVCRTSSPGRVWSWKRKMELGHRGTRPMFPLRVGKERSFQKRKHKKQSSNSLLGWADNVREGSDGVQGV